MNLQQRGWFQKRFGRVFGYSMLILTSLFLISPVFFLFGVTLILLLGVLGVALLRVVVVVVVVLILILILILMRDVI